MTILPPRAIAALDVPAADVAAEAQSLQSLFAVQVGSAAEQRHLVDDTDGLFARMACEHPEACSCEASPDWTAHIAKLGELNAAHRQAAAFNAGHPVGTPVTAYPGARNEQGLDTTTRSEAWVLGGHTAVVMVDGYAGGIALTHIDVRPGGAA
ncbi:hypothetical protein [Streptomyces formicae]